MPEDLFVGIDVSKATLDVAVRPSNESWSVPNSEPGISDLVGRLRELPAPRLVLMEATGGLERQALATIAAAGLPAMAVNPRNVRDFARSVGILAKTDAIDAPSSLCSPTESDPSGVLCPTNRPKPSKPSLSVVVRSST